MGKHRLRVSKPTLIIHKEHIIKLQEETPSHYIGYNVLTEKLVYIPKGKDTIEMPKCVYDILQSEELRIKVALTLFPKRAPLGKFLKISERTVYRALRDLDLPRRLPKPKRPQGQRIKL